MSTFSCTQRHGSARAAVPDGVDVVRGEEVPHQSHIVNLAFVKKIMKKDGGYLELEGERAVPLARSKKTGFLDMVRERFFG